MRAALDVAAAHQARPDEVGDPLVASEDSVAAAHVLVEAQLAAGPQDAAEFGQRRLGRLAVDGARADPDDQGTAAFSAHSGPRRAGPYPDGNPHGTSLPLARFRDTLITVLSDGRR